MKLVQNVYGQNENIFLKYNYFERQNLLRKGEEEYEKEVLATLLVGAMAASLLAGCGTTVETTGSSDTTTAPEKTQTTETAEAGEAGGSDVSADITLWTYPIGEWGNAETVDSLIQDFNKEYPGINVTVEYLDYTNVMIR